MKNPNSVLQYMEMLNKPKKGREGILRSALSSGFLKDPAFVSFLVDRLNDASTVFADLIADEVLPKAGEEIVPMLVEGFDQYPDKVKIRRLRLLSQFDKPSARECARRSLASKHDGLLMECIRVLARSEEDAPFLLRQARGRAAWRSVSAYRALRGISEQSVVTFLTEMLDAGEGHPAKAMAYTPMEPYAAIIISIIQPLNLALEQGRELKTHDARRLLEALRASAGQNSRQLESVLTDSVKLAATRKIDSSEIACFSIDYIQAVLEAIATNPVPVAQRALVDLRDCFAESDQFYSFCAAAQLDEVSLFETFAPTLFTQNSAQRCKGWYCTSRGPWPCSIVSAIEFVMAKNGDSKKRGAPLPHHALVIEKIRSDPRWSSALADLGQAEP